MNGEMHEHEHEHVVAGGGGVDGMQGMRETGMGLHGSEINQGWIQEERGRGGEIRYDLSADGRGQLIVRSGGLIQDWDIRRLAFIAG